MGKQTIAKRYAAAWRIVYLLRGATVFTSANIYHTKLKNNYKNVNVFLV